MPGPDHLYLGDAVYVQHDGWTIGLSLNDHKHAPVIWLEPDVLRGLIEYARKHELLIDPLR